MLSMVLRIIVAVMLLIATFPLPYDYYTLLRIIVFIVSVYCVQVTYQQKLEIWPWIFATVALLFNPLFPIYLQKTTWVFIDIFIAMTFIISFWKPEKLSWRRSIIGIGLFSIIVIVSLWINTLNDLYANRPINPVTSSVVTKHEEKIEQVNFLFRPLFYGATSTTLLFVVVTHCLRRKKETSTS
jgi:hypothetical protein